MKKFNRYLEKNLRYVGFLDIETHGTGFNANDAYLVSWVLEKYDMKTGKSKTYYDILSKKDLKYWNKKMKKDKKLRKLRPYDTEILKSVTEVIKECDIIVGHYSNYFDIPMIRTRCAMLKIPFVKHSDNIRLFDTWNVARYGMKLRRNTLDNLAKTLGVAVNKTTVDYWHWLNGCVYGDKKSLDYILEHNEKDVKVTKSVWLKVEQNAPVTTKRY